MSGQAHPNILFIQADQLAPHALSFHGNAVSKTPHIDRLMKQATVFSNAYCNSPICSPSRFAMMSGQLPTQIGAWDNAAEFPSEVLTFAHMLRMSGYTTTLAGKMHFVGADQLHGFEERLTMDVYPADFGWTPNWDEEYKGMRNPLFFETLKSVAEADWVHSSMQMDFDEEVAFKVKRKLRELGRRRTKRTHDGKAVDQERPFFVLASFTEPHDPYSGPKEFWDQYEGVEIDMPRVPFIPREKRDIHSQRVYDCMDNGDFDITNERIIKSRRAYYSMMSYVDSKVGELVATLEEQGLRDDTLIVFTADHGDMQGERGMWFKETYHERATRVPLFFSATPAFARKYNLCHAPKTVPWNVSLVDLLPTLVEMTTSKGARQDELPCKIEGRSLFPFLCESGDTSQKGVATEDTIYCEYTSEMIPGGWFMVKKSCLKLVYSEHEPLLFDLKTDPDENVNVMGRDSYKHAAEELLILAKAKWPDLKSLSQRILISQRTRRFIHEALTKGKRTFWENEPTGDGCSTYVQNNGEELQDQEYLRRAPYRGKRPVK